MYGTERPPILFITRNVARVEYSAHLFYREFLKCNILISVSYNCIVYTCQMLTCSRLLKPIVQLRKYSTCECSLSSTYFQMDLLSFIYYYNYNITYMKLQTLYMYYLHFQICSLRSYILVFKHLNILQNRNMHYCTPIHCTKHILKCCI